MSYPILYAAYGANTNRAHMKNRCPLAKYVGNCTLHDHAMVFRGVADVVYRPGRETKCALWEIMPSDEQALDRFEGYPFNYTKRFATIQYKGERRRVMFYIMTGTRADQYEPPQSYENTLREGYKQCGGIPQKQITSAIDAAKRSTSRQKTYRGSWVQKDKAAASAQAPAAPMTQRIIDVLGADWFARNFDDSNLKDI